MGDEATTQVQTEDAAATDEGGNETVLPGGADEGATDTNSDDGATDTGGASDDGAGGADEGAAGEAGAEGSDTPPDTYADFVMPDGVTLDETLVTEAVPIFKEMGATQEQAQKLMDIAAKQVQAGSQKHVDDFNQLMSDWKDQAKNDGEFGGDKFDENVKIAQSAISKYGTPELKQLLEDHGVGNHPEVIRFMVRVGHTLKEDVPGATGVATGKSNDRVDILYGNQNKT